MTWRPGSMRSFQSPLHRGHGCEQTFTSVTRAHSFTFNPLFIGVMVANRFMLAAGDTQTRSFNPLFIGVMVAKAGRGAACAGGIRAFNPLFIGVMVANTRLSSFYPKK